MKRGKGKGAPEIAGNFTRGFVATALLTAIQSRWSAGTRPPSGAKVLRHALQGGAALAAGSLAANALRRRKVADAVLAVAGGAAGLLAIEYLLNPPEQVDQEKSLV